MESKKSKSFYWCGTCHQLVSVTPRTGIGRGVRGDGRFPAQKNNKMRNDYHF